MEPGYVPVTVRKRGQTQLHPVSWRHVEPHGQHKVASDMCRLAHDTDLEQD